MNGEQAGPSTPGAGFGSFGRPLQQQRTPSGSGALVQSSSTPLGNEFGLARSSSLRNIQGGQQTHSGFGFGGMREMSTPKTVRWEDGAHDSLQGQRQQQPTLGQQQNSPSSQPSFNPHQSTGMHMPSHQQNQQPSPYSMPYSSSLSSLQTQRTSPQSSFQSQFSSSLSAPSPNHAQSSSSPPTTLQQTRSAFNRSVVEVTRMAKPESAAQPVQPATSAPAKTADDSKDVVIASRPAVLTRIKWNALALLLNWLAPRFSPVGRIYWIMLDVAFSVFGGNADVHLATILSWLHKASTVVLFINLVEAIILLNTASADRPASSTEIVRRKPSLAHPPNRVVSSSSPQTSPSPSPLSSRRNTPHHYAQGSPLRESIFRASASAQGLGEERRMPSQAPRFDRSQKASSSASPLVAFLARKQDRLASGGDVGDLSWDGDADLSTDSIEVDRALRAFSAGYERELSESRSLGMEGGKDGIAV